MDDGFFLSTTIWDGLEPVSGGDGFSLSVTIWDQLEPPAHSDAFVMSTTIWDQLETPVHSDAQFLSVEIREGLVSNTITFTYLLTQITDIIPDPAPIPGGVTIVGTMLDKVKAVYMDGQRTSFIVRSSTEIYAGLPLNVSSTTIEVYLEYDLS